jgi:hypothetical protein
MFILLIDVDDNTRFVVFNDLSLHDMGLLYASLCGLLPSLVEKKTVFINNIHLLVKSF